MSETKIILDACCGSRMFWFDKENPLALFADIRDEEYILCDGRNLKVHPDIVSDFTDMPFLDKSFKLVVFDPPHLLKVGKNSWLAKKYGKLPEDWPRVIKKGIDECFRVLDDYGVLIFKWNEDQITVREVLSAINRQPLFGHTTGRHGKTMWMCFMKLQLTNNRTDREMKTIGFHIGRIGFYLYLQSLWKYKQFYLTPGVMVEGVKGHDVYLDIEIKLLCFSVGFRLIWIKTKRNY